MECWIITQISHLLETGFNKEQALNVIQFMRKHPELIFRTKYGEEVIIKFINKIVFHSEYPNKGYKLLNSMTCYFSKELLLPHSTKWILQIISKHNVTVDTVETLFKVLKVCAGNQEFDKFVYTYLSKIIEMCLVNYTDEYIVECTAYCLSVCIQKYPKSCGLMKHKIEDYTHKYFCKDSTEAVILSVGQVFCYLPRMEASPVSAYSTLFHKICATMHKAYDTFFMSVSEYTITTEWHDNTPFKLEIAEDNVYFILRNLTTFMVSMLTVQYDFEKVIMLQILLDVIKRGLVVDMYDPTNTKTLRMMMFVGRLYNLQINLLNLLKSSIKCFGSNWRPYASQINKLILDCHRRSSKFYFKHDSDFQKELYETFSCWITIVGDMFEPTDHDTILEFILKDVEPFDGHLHTPHFVMVKEKICKYALKACTTFLQSVILQASEKQCCEFFNSVTRYLSEAKGMCGLDPYKNTKCVINLYKLVYTMFSQTYYNKRYFFQRAVPLLNIEHCAYLKLDPEFIKIVDDIDFIAQICANCMDDSKPNLPEPCNNTPVTSGLVKMDVTSNEPIISESVHNFVTNPSLSNIPKISDTSTPVTNELVEMDVTSNELIISESCDNSVMNSLSSIPKTSNTVEVVKDQIEISQKRIESVEEDITVHSATDNDMIVEESVRNTEIMNAKLTNEIDNKTKNNTDTTAINEAVTANMEMNESLEDSGESSSEAEAFLNSFSNTVYDC